MQVTETLKKTGATAAVVAATLMPPLVEMTGEKEPPLCRIIGRNLKEVEYEGKTQNTSTNGYHPLLF